MLRFVLHEKLKKLNPLLYIRGNALYLRSPERKGRLTSAEMQYAGDSRTFLEDNLTGQRDKLIGVVGGEWIPEYDVFDFQNNTLKMKGWRTLLMQLIRTKVVSVDKARKVFNTRSLGDQAWDLAPFETRLAWAKDEKHAL